MSTITSPKCGRAITKENLKNLKIEGNLFIADWHCGNCSAYLNAKRFVTAESLPDEEKAKFEVPPEERVVGSVKQVDGCTILSGTECLSCTSHETRKCPPFSQDLGDAFVCKRCCLTCDRRASCKSPAWINEGEEHDYFKNKREKQ